MADNDPHTHPSTLTGEISGRSRAVEWAALITGRPEVRDESADYALQALMGWWTESAEGIFRKLPDFPEPFQTTKFRKEVRFIELPLTAIKPAFDSLAIGESSVFDALEHLGRNFGWDKERLLRWKEGLENLASLVSWLPEFLHSLDYLNAAVPLGSKEVDHSREALLQTIAEPHHFLEDSTRREFDGKFLEFRKSYADAYYFLHEDALHIVSGTKKDDVKIDPVPLRNLDLLSGLPHMDKSYLNRVKLLARWVQRNQCNLPVRQILERYPRCYCNFLPSSHQHPADSAAQINSTIRDGIEHFRSLLRKCSEQIQAELTEQQANDSARQPILDLLGEGPVPPLKPQTIKVLHRVIAKNPNAFLSAIRKK